MAKWMAEMTEDLAQARHRADEYKRAMAEWRAAVTEEERAEMDVDRLERRLGKPSIRETYSLFS